MTVDVVLRHRIPDQDREPTRALLRTLRDVGAGDRVHVVVVDASGGRRHAAVPASVMGALDGVVGLLAEKGEAMVLDDEEEITPEAAAPLLGMSRPMVVHRVKQGDIPCRMVGTHHKLKLSDVIAFREEEDRRRQALADIGEHTDEMTLRHGP